MQFCAGAEGCVFTVTAYDGSVAKLVGKGERTRLGNRDKVTCAGLQYQSGAGQSRDRPADRVAG